MCCGPALIKRWVYNAGGAKNIILNYHAIPIGRPAGQNSIPQCTAKKIAYPDVEIFFCIPCIIAATGRKFHFVVRKKDVLLCIFMYDARGISSVRIYFCKAKSDACISSDI